ncbi:MAG TPA: ABC transporter substrate-binding protein [Gemmataceae bacterium]|jgi:branched-chain amino acid transport system substrate-binding protein|nr:ABC transporter substrate-binding protein [Gemmataceae bacterium]
MAHNFHPRAWARGFLLLALLFVPFGCSWFKSTPEPHLVGHLAPLTGPDQAIGQRSEMAVRMAVEKANQEEKIDGKSVAAIHGDTGSDPNAMQFQATRLLAVNNVKALIGVYYSAQLDSVLPLLQAHQIVLVTPSGGLATGTSRLIYPVGLAAKERGKHLAKFAVEEKKITDIVPVIDLSNPLFSSISEAFATEFRHDDRKLQSEVTFSKPAEFPELTNRIFDSKPKTILFCGKAGDLLNLRASLKQKGLPDDVPWLFGGEEEEPVLQSDPARSQGVFFTSAFTLEDKAEGLQAFVTNFQSRISQPPDVFVVLSNDAANLLFSAARRAKSFKTESPSKFTDQLSKPQEFKFNCLTGGFRLEKDGTAVRTVYVLQMERGKSKLAKSYPVPKIE